MKKKTTIEAIQRDILALALPNVPFDGWTNALFERAVEQSDYARDMVDAALPHDVRDLVLCFARMMDDDMMTRLSKFNAVDMRVRDKVKLGVQARLAALKKYREAERMAVGFWTMPTQSRHGVKSVWKTADLIWDFAGDTATDYNRYTKRLLLSGVLTKTTLYWLNDTSDNYIDTDAFLDRQIDRILTMGKIMGRGKGTLDRLWEFMPFSKRQDRA